MKAKLSVVITAYNEEAKLEDCLRSSSFADEIIVVDNSSADKTVAIAKKYTEKLYTRPNTPMLNSNKNFGFTKASGDWILNLDPDERVTDGLREEIQQILSKESSYDGYLIPRKNIIFGKWIQHTGWYPDYQLRFFKTGKGKFPEKHVHELVQVEGAVGKLTEAIFHLNYDSVSQFIYKHAELYAANEAENLFAKGYIFCWQDAFWFPFKEFLSRFFAREGYKDGLHGFVLSLLLAFYHLVIFAKMWEKQGFPEYKDSKLLDDLSKETKTAKKQLNYWFANEKLKQTKQPMQQLPLKIIRKLNS